MSIEEGHSHCCEKETEEREEFPIDRKGKWSIEEGHSHSSASEKEEIKHSSDRQDKRSRKENNQKKGGPHVIKEARSAARQTMRML